MTAYNTGTTVSIQNAVSNTGTITIPAGVKAGDAVLVMVHTFTTAVTGTPGHTLTSTATAPAQVGALQNAGNHGGILAYGTIWLVNAGAADPGATLTFTATGLSGGNYWFNVGLVAYTGFSSSPVDVNAGLGSFDTTSAGDTTTPAATTTAAGDWQVQLLGVDPPGSNDLTTPAGLTLRQNVGPATNAGLLLKIADSNGGVGGAGTGIGNTLWSHSGAGSGNTWRAVFTVGLAIPVAAGPAQGGGTSMLKRSQLWADL